MDIDKRTAMADSVLREIAQHLVRLAQHGVPAAIDLLSLPLTEPDRDELEARLGYGQVEATLCAGGDSKLWETTYPGVWWIRHLSSGNRPVSERIEIAAFPAILASDGADILAGSLRLEAELEHSSAEPIDNE